MNTLKQILYNFLIYIRILFILPGIDWRNEKLLMDLNRWSEILSISGSRVDVLAALMNDYPEFRNLYMYRCKNGLYKRWVKLFYRPMNTLYIMCDEIGGGLFIQHGFATYIAAKSIGKNCWINQQVTIGYTGHGGPPIIGDNVTITCGAKVIGPVTLGDNAIIGANAVVVKDVEPNAVMVGIPAKRIK